MKLIEKIRDIFHFRWVNNGKISKQKNSIKTKNLDHNTLQQGANNQIQKLSISNYDVFSKNIVHSQKLINYYTNIIKECDVCIKK